jgi:hypothetical protein
MIQDSDSEVHGPSYSGSTPTMASSSKRNTNQQKSKDSESNLNSNAAATISGLTPQTEALHAFRTITTMLSHIHSIRDTAAGKQPKLPSGSNEKKRLQVLDALAALLIRSDGVAAVTARPQADGSGKVEVLASFLGSAEKLLTHPISQPASPIQFLRNIFISQNPRDSSVKQRKVVDPETLAVTGPFKEISDPTKLLNKFLTDIW